MSLIVHPELKPKVIIDVARHLDPEAILGGILGPSLIPDDPPQQTLDLKIIKGAANSPVMAQPTHYSSDPIPSGRIGLDIIEGQLPAMKASRIIDADTIMNLTFPRSNAETQDILTEIYEDVAFVTKSIHAQVEWMRWQSLMKGKIQFTNAAGYKIIADFDYSRTGTHTVTLAAGALWSAYDTSDPLTNFNTWADIVEATSGVRPTRCYMPRAVLAHLKKNEKIRQMIYATWDTTKAATYQITNDQLNTLLLSLELPMITTYDRKAYQENNAGTKTAVPYLSAGYVVLMPPPDIKVGTVKWGPTLEALAEGSIEASEKAGLFVEIIEERNPVRVMTKSAATVLPSLPGIDFTLCAKVLA